MITFEIKNVPPNFSNSNLHGIAKSKVMKQWQSSSILYGMDARHDAGADVVLPGERRHVEVVLVHPRLYDREGAWSAVKPIVDGLQAFVKRRVPHADGTYHMVDVPGAGLIWKDDEDHITINVSQRKDTNKARARTIVSVSDETKDSE